MTKKSNSLNFVRSQIVIRTKAEEYFGEIAAMDAGWQTLLYLFLNPLLERELILLDLQTQLGIPETTLRRCLLFAENKDFVLATPTGGTKIRLSEQAQAKMEDLFEVACSSLSSADQER